MFDTMQRVVAFDTYKEDTSPANTFRDARTPEHAHPNGKQASTFLPTPAYLHAHDLHILPWKTL